MNALSWSACQPPCLPSTRGQYVDVDPLNVAKDAADLFGAVGGPGNDDLWRFIPLGPFDSADQLIGVMSGLAQGLGWRTHVLRKPSDGTVLGMASYMHLRPEVGAAEVGCIVFSKALQQTPAATEAMFIMARHLFEDLGYRRYEWRCDDRNAASKRAAERIGFTFEGLARQDVVVRDENRDTASYSLLDREWPPAKAAFESWLSAENFDDAGNQRQSLAAFQSV